VLANYCYCNTNLTDFTYYLCRFLAE